ncbi:glycine betaine ABC transporter substrate-binding protein [Kocuria carniphila]|uniref:Glycine betaine ABC transporter substrate-binding protein n=1 Tax=Kocuria carniphila TaxID=262208 RepID=A0ABV3V286_9MICC
MTTAEQSSNARLVYGRIDESFHQVAAAVVEEVLVRLGHTVDVVEGPHPEMYPQLAAGEMDLFADAWLPGGHEVYWEQVKDNAVEAAVLYEGCMFYWAVPAYIPEDLVFSLADLAKPGVAERMTTLTVQGTTSGAGLTMRSEQLIESYGLASLGWHQEIGDLQAIIDTVNQRMKAGDWFATPLWQPQYLNDVYELRPLADPLGAFPAPDRASLLAYRQSWDNLPEETRRVVARINYPLEAVNEMDRAVNLDGKDPLQAARDWMERNPETVNGWFA